VPSTELFKRLATPSKQNVFYLAVPQIPLVREEQRNLDVGVLLPVSPVNMGIWRTKKITKQNVSNWNLVPEPDLLYCVSP